MDRKRLTRSEDNKEALDRGKSTRNHDSLHQRKESSSCGSCGVCGMLRSPHPGSEIISRALSRAKVLGKETCAVSFMQRNHGNRFTVQAVNTILQKGTPAIQRKCACAGPCPNCTDKEEEEGEGRKIQTKLAVGPVNPKGTDNMEFRPDLKGKKVEVAVELPKPPPIRISLKELQESPDYGDFPESQTPGMVMAKRFTGVIQREETPKGKPKGKTPKGKPKIEAGVAYPFSLYTALSCSDCNLAYFKGLLGEAQMGTDWSLQLSWQKQLGQGAEPPYSSYALQLALTAYKEDISLLTGIWLNQVTLALIPYFILSNDPSGPYYKGGIQPQLQVRILEYKNSEINLGINTAGEYTPPYWDRNGQEVAGELKWFKSLGLGAAFSLSL